MSVEEENRQVHSRACGVGRRPRPRKVGSSWAMRAMKIWSRFILCIPLLTLEKAFWGITPQFVNHVAITKNLFFPEWHQNFCRKDSLGMTSKSILATARSVISAALTILATIRLQPQFRLFSVIQKSRKAVSAQSNGNERHDTDDCWSMTFRWNLSISEPKALEIWGASNDSKLGNWLSWIVNWARESQNKKLLWIPLTQGWN